MLHLDLPDVDALREERVGDCDVIIHNDHRFALIPAFLAQQRSLLPRPATLISFDRHHDALELRRGRDPLTTFQLEQTTTAEIVDLCRDHLSSLDDDWIKAGMELGIISDAAVFGVQDDSHADNLLEYVDSRGTLHRTFILGLPGNALAFQGYLSDFARREELAELWRVLNWDPRNGGFTENAQGWWLSIDLDLFVVTWETYTLPWPDEIYEGEFSLEPGYGAVDHLNGCRLFHEFVRRAGLITVAREPTYCGGESKCDRIWSDVKRILFGPCN
jgi:hypothetical protein